MDSLVIWLKCEREGGRGDTSWNQLDCFYCSGRSLCCCQAAWLRVVALPDANNSSKTSHWLPVALSLSARVAGAPVLAAALSAEPSPAVASSPQPERDSPKPAQLLKSVQKCGALSTLAPGEPRATPAFLDVFGPGTIRGGCANTRVSCRFQLEFT